jgi:nitroimidazol reductase NimA-like FMN-containing flavoprotein (pyridoxamine 5'-phosphate oxidase superfamily)
MVHGRYGTDMEEDEIAAFLADEGHGVLSFSGDPAYGLPISFGYDVSNDRCVFQLLFAEGSRKRSYLEQSASVNLVAYDWAGPDDWRSVVVDGVLSRVEAGSADEADASAVFAECASVPGLSVFEGSVDELVPELYELRIEEMNGRRSPALS